MTAKTIVPNKREATYLRGLAQEALQAEDRTAAILTAIRIRATATDALVASFIKRPPSAMAIVDAPSSVTDFCG